MDEALSRKFGTRIHISALDGIINVNSLFTFAVFIGLAWNPHDQTGSLIDDQSCFPGSKIAEDLVAFHVYSFSAFLFSSLVAVALKMAIRLSDSVHFRTVFTFDLANINTTLLRVGYLISAAGSVVGSIFLMLALVNVVQIKLGILACGSLHSYGAVVPLAILVPVALVIYVSMVFYAFTRG